MSAGTGDSSTAARAIAIVALRRAVDEGVPFTTDLDLAAALGLPADDVAALKPFAEKGVATKAALAAAVRRGRRRDRAGDDQGQSECRVLRPDHRRHRLAGDGAADGAG